NNRPCGGARGAFCNHIRALITDAVLQYGAGRAARYLKVDTEDAAPDAASLTGAMTLTLPPQGATSAAAPVLRRFTRHPAYLEFEPVTTPLPEIQWFPTTRTVA